MRRTMLAVSALVLAVGLAAPAVSQVNGPVARGAAVPHQFCKNHKAMQDALFVDYIQVFGGGGFSAKASYMSHVVRRPADDQQAIGRLAKVHDRMMLALRGETRGLQGLRQAPAPSPELGETSLANLSSLCELHGMLHQTFAAGRPTDIRTLRSQIESASASCPHGA